MLPIGVIARVLFVVWVADQRAFKRSIKGTYVSVDPFHLFRYLDEQAFRFNERTENDLGRFVHVLKNILGKRLTYAELISADMAPATT